MKLKSLIRVGLLGLAVSAPILPAAHAQSVLRVINGAASSSISVATNRAIVMESNQPFSELSVANPGIADIATLGERTIYVLGKAPGRTTLTILGPEGDLITNVDVQVVPDVAEFKERLRDIMPRENIEVRTANDGIVLSGRVSGARKVQRALELAERYAPGRVTNLLMVGGTQQVMLKVRFAEMTRSVAKGLTTNFGITALGADLQLSGASIAGIGGQITDQIGIGGSNTGAFGATFQSGDVAINLLVEALETKGLVRTLAEPNLVAVSGSSAEFLAGGEFPIPVVDEDAVSIEYRTFGVELEFLPTVIDDDIIKLELETEVSAIDSANAIIQNGFEVPAFSVRRATTSIEMRDGQSFAIAGLLQDDFTDSIGQVPWLGDIPVLGAMFRSTNFQRSQSELVIIVTPHLVTPTVGEALSLPTDRMRIPNERELFLGGQIVGSGAAADVAREDFQGAYGYVME
ncbi:MAG: type II and III secretion system protein family protein [Pseudomonadota bacterium]